MRLVVAMTGASGAALGIRLLERLRDVPSVETHLVISRWARQTIRQEATRSAREVASLADHVYHPDDLAAPISSGSFLTDGMVVVPCSMKTLAGIRVGYGDGLITRAADVTLKERRKLVLVVRETPLSEIHLENMLSLARMGVSILPPMPAFYTMPSTIQDVVDGIVARVLDQFGVAVPGTRRWAGTGAALGLVKQADNC
jgi:4-hydroxy-3-polyprenylbenzoate decarboxylase